MPSSLFFFEIISLRLPFSGDISVGLSEVALLDFRFVDLLTADDSETSEVDDLLAFLECLCCFFRDGVVEDDSWPSDVVALSRPIGVGILDLGLLSSSGPDVIADL